MSGEILGTIRASSWASLFDCPARWAYTNIMGLRLPSSPPAALGTAIHAGTAVFDLARLNGQEPDIDTAIDTSRAALRQPDDEVDWSADDELTPRIADELAVRLTARYCQEVAPTQTYCAVELTCEALDISTPHGIVRLTGTTDRIRILADGRKGIADLKSGKRAVEADNRGHRRAVTAGHHMQLGAYTLLSEQASGEVLDAPAAIIGLGTTKEAPVAIGECGDVKRALLGTDEQPGMIVMAAHMLKTGDFRPNPRSWTCSQRFCPGWNRCIFHD